MILWLKWILFWDVSKVNWSNCSIWELYTYFFKYTYIFLKFFFNRQNHPLFLKRNNIFKSLIQKLRDDALTISIMTLEVNWESFLIVTDSRKQFQQIALNIDVSFCILLPCVPRWLLHLYNVCIARTYISPDS